MKFFSPDWLLPRAGNVTGPKGPCSQAPSTSWIHLWGCRSNYWINIPGDTVPVHSTNQFNNDGKHGLQPCKVISKTMAAIWVRICLAKHHRSDSAASWCPLWRVVYQWTGISSPWTASGRALMWNEPWTQPGLEMWGQVGWLPCLSSQHGWWNGKTNKQIKTLCTCLVPADTCYGGVFYLACTDLGRMFNHSFPACFFFFFKWRLAHIH